MTDKTKALEDLLAKVEAGDRVARYEASKTFGPAFGYAHSVSAYNAYHGSLDAVKKLHAAVLGNTWTFQIKDGHQNTNEFQADVWKMDERGNSSIYNEHSRTYHSPARAWLIAILHALIWEATP